MLGYTRLQIMVYLYIYIYPYYSTLTYRDSQQMCVLILLHWVDGRRVYTYTSDVRLRRTGKHRQDYNAVPVWVYGCISASIYYLSKTSNKLIGTL
jgi:hypothetical protein